MRYANIRRNNLEITLQIMFDQESYFQFLCSFTNQLNLIKSEETACCVAGKVKHLISVSTRRSIRQISHHKRFKDQGFEL